MTSGLAVALLLGAPLVGAAVLALPVSARSPRFRSAIVVTSLGLTAAGLVGGLASYPVLGSPVSYALDLGPIDPAAGSASGAWTLAPVALSGVFLALALRARSRRLIALAAIQLTVAALIPLADLLRAPAEPSGRTGAALALDPLAATLLLVSVLVGGLIATYAIGYEPAHLAHRGLAVGRTARFLGWLLVFISAMNLLVLANDLRVLVVGWELTTLCSFVLIGFDGGRAPEGAARRALAYNLLGGIALASAQLLAGPGARLSDIAGGAVAGQASLPLILAGCVVAAATKSALTPFHPWLLGAMIAAAPVSALLHASAMVKAGSYLLLRLAPAFAADDLIGPAVALLGAFTFASAAVLALRERDLKRVLALSTISSLGLIAAAAGLRSPAALAAGTLLLVFHAAAKALAFLAVGAIEQVRGSRDLEVLVGSLRTVPRLAAPLVVAAVALALPPFGLVVAKWAITELGARDVWFVALVALGGAASLALWTAVVGRLLVRRPGRRPEPLPEDRRLPLSERASIGVLVTGTIAGLVAAAPIAGLLADPAGEAAFSTDPGLAAGWSIALASGAFAVPVVAALMVGAAIVAIVVGRLVRRVAPSPYLSGAGLPLVSATAFHGVRGRPVAARSGGFYWGGRDGSGDGSGDGSVDGESAADAGRPPIVPGDRLAGWVAAGGWLAIALVLAAGVIGAIVRGLVR